MKPKGGAKKCDSFILANGKADFSPNLQSLFTTALVLVVFKMACVWAKKAKLLFKAVSLKVSSVERSDRTCNVPLMSVILHLFVE